VVPPLSLDNIEIIIKVALIARLNASYFNLETAAALAGLSMLVLMTFPLDFRKVPAAVGPPPPAATGTKSSSRDSHTWWKNKTKVFEK
jgi:hypothetical protein